MQIYLITSFIIWMLSILIIYLVKKRYNYVLETEKMRTSHIYIVNCLFLSLIPFLRFGLLIIIVLGLYVKVKKYHEKTFEEEGENEK